MTRFARDALWDKTRTRVTRIRTHQELSGFRPRGVCPPSQGTVVDQTTPRHIALWHRPLRQAALSTNCTPCAFVCGTLRFLHRSALGSFVMPDLEHATRAGGYSTSRPLQDASHPHSLALPTAAARTSQRVARSPRRLGRAVLETFTQNVTPLLLPSSMANTASEALRARTASCMLRVREKSCVRPLSVLPHGETRQATAADRQRKQASKKRSMHASERSSPPSPRIPSPLGCRT